MTISLFLGLQLQVAILILVLVRINVGDGINYRLSQPQIWIDDGHMYFVPAEHRNLVLVANGTGKIIFNDIELNKIVTGMNNITREQKNFKRMFGNPTNSSFGGGVVGRVRRLEQRIGGQMSQVGTFDRRITVLERQISGLNSSDSTSDQAQQSGATVLARGIRRRVVALERRVRDLASRNPCDSNPCQNSGTCIPTIFGPFCFCPPGWEGNRCQLDVNECAAFAGSGLGCQNGAQCVNTPGSYQCTCRGGWLGIHCTVRSGDCSSGPGWELCGHGICINQHTGSRPYTCICEQGWKTDGTNPSCTIDVNECDDPHPSCSVNPFVNCVNTPGSFHCAPCPAGYTGNGYHCTDINECLQNNGGCSTNPYVQCLNTVGSRTCGECPPGYIGNGIACQYIGMCQINNGGCHPLARCIQNPAIGQSFVQCICPPNYGGTGMGLHGCFPYGGGGTDVGPLNPGLNPCSTNPCVHGTCTPNGANFICTCQLGFTGQTCSLRLDPCLSNPCQNGGTCSSTADRFQCHCPNDFTGLRCENQEQACGGTIENVEGNFRYPHDSSQTYRHNTNCMWTMRTDLGKVLNVTFTRFHLEGGGSCNFDWLQIHDGFDSRAPLIGKFCGEILPNGGSIVSTHETLFLWFRSDHSTTGLGFDFNWNSTNAVCGEVISGNTHGSINSPGYPGNYPHSRDCLWTISVSLSKRIQLVFATLQLEIHPNCSYDYLEVRDGLEDNAPVLGMYCNTTLPPPLLSSGPYLRLLLHTDASASDMGFHVTYAEVPGVPGCGGVFTESRGGISSPQHPEPYQHGLDCEYLIRLPTPDERISLTFLEFELESGSNCRYDFVEIRDGSRPDSPLIGRFCERNRPPILRSTTNVLLVRFRSDASVAFGGFRAKYESVCGGTFSTDVGILRSPYYPQAYPKNRECVYIISQPVSKAIRLDFSDFDIEGSSPNSCSFDYLEIRDGDNENSTLIGHFCGPLQSKPDPIISTFNYLWLRFKTDGSVQNRGFLSNYSTFDISCGGILRESHGILSSPGHPEVYPHGVSCTWIIRGVPGEVIRLNWVSFSLERNLRCRYDSVEIYDNSTLFSNNGNGSLVGRYCGQEIPPQMTSSDYTMTIRFKSDHSVAHDGFMANYVLVNSSKVCGANYFTETGVLRSPGYGSKYPHGKSCIWTIKVPMGQQIMLNITDFDVENGTSQGCPYDYLEIRNGGFITSPLIGKYCGGANLPPPRIPSATNTLYLKFVTDVSRSGRGFEIVWDGTSTGCGATLKAPSGSLVSPNYPSSSGIRTECVWNIAVNQGSAIQFSFVDLDIQRSSNCLTEYVELRDGPRPNSPLLGKYCTEDSMLAINSTGSTIRVKFVSRYGTTGRGFHAVYQTICRRQIRGYSGTIESPNFPELYPMNRNCSWEVVVAQGNKLNISFSHFSVEDPHASSEQCRYDFVEIKETSQLLEQPTSPTSLGKFCGNTIPPMIPSTQDTAIINFVSDASLARNGFRLEWVVNGCGGRIFENWAQVKSPGYPRPYPHRVVCEWYIETPLGTRASLTIYDLDMEKAISCVYDSLSVYAGPDDTSALLTQLCHKQERPVTVTGHGNKMFLRFRSDSTVSAKGFYGYVTSMEGGCGGVITAPTGFIYSPNYPSNYNHDDDCGWKIKVDTNHVVELTFLDFNVERHINCSYDHVAIYDGESTSSPLLLMACGDQMPEPSVIKSTGDTMYVRLKTDGSTSSKGFKANYTMGCGARLGGQRRGTISSPGFPHFIFRLNCTWFISGSRPEDRVTLTFTHMDLQTAENENCDRDYVEVLDGEDFEAPSIGKYCFSRIPPALTSTGNNLVVRISTLDSWGFGFRANYDVSAGACGGTLTSAEGSFISPNFPHGYLPSTECAWTIQASQGNRVQLSFRRFEIEANDFCNTDYLEVHENGPAGLLLGHFCGNEIPANLTTARVLWVIFRADAEGQAPGFLADYSLVHGNELSGSVGSVESPLYPLPMYLLGTYSWKIFVNQSGVVRIRFNVFDFEHDTTTDSCGNHLKIFDGYDDNSPQLFFACDKNTPEPVISTGNVVQVVMFRGYTRIGSLFQLTWDEVSSAEVAQNAPLTSNVTGCGGRVDLPLGNLTSLMSPGYGVFPGYGPNLRCEWIINSPPNYRIEMKIEDLDMESHYTCQYDKVEVYDGENGQPNYVLNQTLCQRTQRDLILVSSGRTMKLVFITDASVSRPGFNFTLRSICGGFIRDARGRISSPNFPQNYGQAKCTWIVTVRPGRTINISIRTLDIYAGTRMECSTDQLILRNGGHADSPFLGPGRFCGTTIPTIPDTIGNQLYIQFNSWTTSNRGFELIYSEVSIGCGGQIHLTDDAGLYPFSSPNYPNVPPPFTECEWVFTVPQNEVVQLDFQLTFNMRSSYRCDIEGVEVRDGGTRMSPIINMFCNADGELPPTQKSTGNIMYVRYYTNSNEPRNGFKAQSSIAVCGGTFTGWYGTIMSPGFPVSYEPNLDCLWTIRGPSGAYMILEFIDLEVGNMRLVNINATGGTCTRDLVQITEANITEIASPRTWNFCGISATMSPLSSIQSSTNQIRISFRSDASRETKKGFKLRYRASIERCGGTISQPSGTIQSVNYPLPYSHNRWCYWRIIAPLDRRIRLEFIDFDLEERMITATSNYCVDYVSVSQTLPDYYYGNNQLYNNSLCGINLPPPVETTQNTMEIRFRTDGSVSHRGFRARFTTDLPSLCGGEITGDVGVIISPTERTGTPNETTVVLCSWKHPGEGENSTTILTLRDLKLPPWSVETVQDCPSGHVQVKPFGGDTYQWRKYCGRQSNLKIYIPGNYFEVEYIAKNLESTFNLTYQVIGCGGLITEPNSTIQSPNFPTAYATNIECIWKINFRAAQIQLVVTDLDLDDHRDTDGCDRDYLVVRNGLYPSSPVLGKYCGTNIPPDIISMSSGLWLEFHSDENGNGNRRGFRLEAEALEKGCGGIIHNKRGTISSPKTSTSVPRYPNNVECEWIIETVPGYMVNLEFDGRFEIEAQTNCTNDFVEIFQKKGFMWNSMGRFCGRQMPAPINTTSTTVKVLFRSNDAIDGDGFILNWYSPCGGIFSEESGVLRSAHYDRFNHSSHVDPGSFWAKSYVGWENTWRVQQCDYTIQEGNGSRNSYIVLQFLEPFDVSVPANQGWRLTDLRENCPIVNMTLYEGNGTELRSNPYGYYPRLGLFCGQEVPSTFIGRGAFTMSYNYMPYFENYGFRAEYNIYNCGGEIREATSIQSPGHPFTSAPNMNCTWIIRAPVGKVVRFKFDRMELEFSTTCSFDYVNLFNGDWANPELRLGTFCGNLTEDISRIISMGDSMTVQFITDHSVHQSGFKGSVDFTIGPSGGCGGRINGSNAGIQNIRSPDTDNDGKYDSYLDCQWLIIGPDFQVIDLTFTSFVVEGNQKSGGATTTLLSSEDCPFDYIEIRDGLGSVESVLGKFCGSTPPPRITSSSNFLWINFVSDGSYQFSGFRASISFRPSPCGISFVFNATATAQVLNSPLNPANYGPNLRCRWTVDGARPNDEVDIRFLDMDIEGSPDCVKDRLQIRDISSSYTSPEGIGGPILFNGNQATDWRFRNLDDIDTASIMKNFKYCGTQTPSDFLSVGRSVEILFDTDTSGSGRGFQLEYKAAGCNRTYESSQGRVFSPEWPTYSPIFTNCVKMIRTTNGTTISLYFNDFLLEESDGCTESFFEARELNQNGELLGRYCGTTRPNPIFSQTNTLWINYLTKLHPNRGFDFSFTTTNAGVGCGGDLFHTGGSLASPFYPGNFSQNSDCRWRLRVPAGLRLNLLFTSFMIGGDCDKTFLEIFSMNSHDMSSDPVLFTRYCPGDIPSTYNGETDMAMVRYKSNVNSTGMGWRIEFKGRQASAA